MRDGEIYAFQMAYEDRHPAELLVQNVVQVHYEFPPILSCTWQGDKDFLGVSWESLDSLRICSFQPKYVRYLLTPTIEDVLSITKLPSYVIKEA